MKAVFVGNDSPTANLVELAMRLRWQDVKWKVASTGEEGLQLIDQLAPELVYLRPDLEDLSLSGFLIRLRCFNTVPTMVLSCTGDDLEVVTALEMGADDYLRLPCDLTELMARSWALLRRSGRGDSSVEMPLAVGELSINPGTHEVFLQNRRLNLTVTEFRLLYVLMRNQGHIVTHGMLQQALSNNDIDSHSAVKKYIQRLRKKLGDDPRRPAWIASVHGVGYRFITREQVGAR